MPQIPLYFKKKLFEIVIIVFTKILKYANVNYID